MNILVLIRILVLVDGTKNYRKEGVQMKLRKTIQKKFRIDSNTEKVLQIVLTNNKVSFQFAMESLLREYIYNNLEIVIKKN